MRAFLFISLLLLTACSGKDPSKAQFELNLQGLAASATANAGLIIFGTSGEDKFTRLASGGGTIQISLPHGIWNIGAIAWDGSTPMTGTVYCALNKSVSIEGETSIVDLNLQNSTCFTSDFSTEAGPSTAKTITPQFCENNVSSMAGTCDYDPTAPPPAQKRGFIGGYRFRISSGQNFSSAGSHTPQHLETLCFNAETNMEFGGSTLISSLNIPALAQGLGIPLHIDAFLSPDCDATRGVLPKSFTVSAEAKFDNATPKNALVSTPMLAVCGTASLVGNSDFASGGGGPSFPYVICNAGHLANLQRNYDVNSYHDDYFILAGDINLLPGIMLGNNSGAYDPDLEDGNTFVPIGLYFDVSGNIQEWSNPFSGGFDGNGFFIRHFRFKNNNSSAKTGFIFNVQGPGAYITNLSFSDAAVEGNDYTGVVAGSVSNAYLRNLRIFKATIEGELQTGSITGNAFNTTSEDIAALKVDVEGKQFTGGLIGTTTGTITKAVFDGWIYADDGEESVGGIVGSTTGAITEAMTSGYIRGSITKVGGIAGDSNGISITFARSTMLIKDLGIFDTSPRFYGGIVGSAVNTHVLRSIFMGKVRHNCTNAGSCDVGGLSGTALLTRTYTVSTEPLADGAGMTGAGTMAVGTAFSTSASTALCNSYGGTCPWSQISGDMPRLSFETHPCMSPANLATVGTQAATRGSTAGNPITICNPSQFSVAGQTDKFFKVLQDINLSGNLSDAGALASNFDGGGNLLYSYNESTTGNHDGLFPSVASGKSLSNFVVADFNISDSGSCSSGTCRKAFVAAFNSGTIENVEARDSLLEISASSNMRVGGLVGDNLGVIRNSKVRHPKIRGYLAGGIAGVNSGTIEGSLSEAEMVGFSGGSYKLGGVAGVSSGKILKTRFGGSISMAHTSTSFHGIGGLVGVMQDPLASGAPDSLIEDCEVSSEAKIEIPTGINAGGLAGYSDSVENDIIRSLYRGFMLEPANTGTVNNFLGDGSVNAPNTFIFHPSYKVAEAGAALSATWNSTTKLCDIDITTTGSPSISVLRGAVKIDFNYIHGELVVNGADDFTLNGHTSEKDCNDFGLTTGDFYEGWDTQLPMGPGALIAAGFDLIRIDPAFPLERSRLYNAYQSFLQTGTMANPPIWISDKGDKGIELFIDKD